VLVLHNCAVTVSSTGAGNQFQADDNGHVGRPSLALVLVLVLHRGAVTVSSTGAKNLLQGDDNGHVGRPC
jgi:hypothetical protein